LHLVDILFPHINDDARSKSHQTSRELFAHDIDGLLHQIPWNPA